MRLPAIKFSQGELQRFDEAIKKEWLITNGLGGYASATILGLNTRKYHGLLVAALHPPADRTVCLSKLDEEAIIENAIYPLNSNEFQDRIAPGGYQFLRAFSISPFPTYNYAVEGVEIEKTIFMPQERNAVVALYKIQIKNQRVAFRIYPLLNFRHFHSVTDKSSKTDLLQNSHSRAVEVTAQKPQVTIALSATEGEFKKQPVWISRLFYREEAARGESSFDDCYQPGYFEIQTTPNQTKEFAIVVTADENRSASMATLLAIGQKTSTAKTLLKREAVHLEETAKKSYDQNRQARAYGWLGWILRAADTFVVRSLGEARAVIAGYHWFEAWGRDTFISLPGLVLATGRNEDAKRILLGFAKHIKKGLIPNFMADKSNEPSYNTVDATLWYINAVLQYLQYTGDLEFVNVHLWEKLKTIIEHHIDGTEHGIRADNDGLLAHGPQLTWMDSQIDGKAVTPREGKAVEVQALWYNALKTMQLIAGRFEEKSLAEVYSSMATKAKENFNNKFWNTQKNCLFDTISNSGFDASTRPNQVIAASLCYPIIDKEKAKQMLDTVYHQLVTPCGLRTLATSESGYIGVYEGDRRQRDLAYHNGTVWPWLVGPFVTAYLKTEGHSDSSREIVVKLLDSLMSNQIFNAGLGTISEICDGDPPHTPRGCISQAWSVAEPLRAYIEDVLLIRPKHEKDIC
jgi:predicted glycogen debranching enzyme